MHTPGHAVLNLALAAAVAPRGFELPVIAGAIAPDLPVWALWIRERLIRGTPEEEIWRVHYQQPGWLRIIHGMHSLPLAAIGLAGSFALGWWTGVAFFASAVLHSLADLPIHVHDAHRHFLPFSHYRLISSISYWDVRYHARVVALVEVFIVAGGSVVLGARGTTPAGTALLALVLGWYLFNYWSSFLRRARSVS